MIGSVPESSLPLTGGCNCGAVRFELTETPLRAGYCHCTRCQRRTGTAASPSAIANPGTFRIVSGEDHIRRWNAGDGADKAFCGTCGSAVFGQHPETRRSSTFAWDPSTATPGYGRWVACMLSAPPFGSQFPTTACPAFPDLSKRNPTPRRLVAPHWAAQPPTFRRCLSALDRLLRADARRPAPKRPH
jgi:hypothetical protein